MGNALIAALLDAEIARLLSERQRLSGVSLRELSRLSGVKLTRLGDILKRGRAATAGEIERIAEALGLEGWKVLFAAQTGRSYAEADDALAERRLGEEAAGETSPPSSTTPPGSLRRGSGGLDAGVSLSETSAAPHAYRVGCDT